MKEKIETVLRFLDELGIEYDIVCHEPAATIEKCEEVEKLIGAKICKNLFLTTSSKSCFWLLMMGGEKRFVTKDVSKKLGSSRLSFADGEMMENMLGTSPGSLSILSLMFDKDKRVRLAADRDVFSDEFICCHPCDNTATLKLKTSEVEKIILPALGAEPFLIDI